MKTPIWKYKEFWTLVITQVIAAAVFFGGRYLAPDNFEIIVFLTGMFETVGLFLAGVFATQRLGGEIEHNRSTMKAITRTLERDHKL